MKKIILIVFGLVLLVAFAIFIAFKQTENLPSSYSKEDPSAPKAQIEHSFFDFGLITSEDKKSHAFEIENIGKNPLRLSNIKTSCDCTSAIVKIAGVESPSFSMHTNKDWSGEVNPGEKAEVIATYDPSVHPINGKVERQIYIKTNDPNMENLILNIGVEGK